MANIFLYEYKIKFLGQKLVYITEPISDYMALDNFYIKLLLAFGPLICIIFLFYSYKLISTLLYYKLYIEVLVMVSIAIYGISENFLNSFHINYSTIFLSFLLYKNKISEYKMEKVSW